MAENKLQTWSVAGEKGPIADVIARIAANDKISDTDKAYLTGKIERSGFAGVVVDAHEFFHAGQTNLTLTIKQLY